MNILLKKVALLYGALVITIFGGTVAHGLVWYAQKSADRMEEDYDTITIDSPSAVHITVTSTKKGKTIKAVQKSTQSDDDAASE